MFRRRAAGESMTEIAESFGLSRETLSKDFTRAYQLALQEEKAGAEVWRRFQTDRLETLLRAVWPRATAPSPVFNREGDLVSEEIDLKASEQARKLIADLCRVNGTDAPVRTEVTGADGEALSLGGSALAELDALIGGSRKALDPTDTNDSEEAGADSDD